MSSRRCRARTCRWSPSAGRRPPAAGRIEGPGAVRMPDRVVDAAATVAEAVVRALTGRPPRSGPRRRGPASGAGRMPASPATRSHSRRRSRRREPGRPARGRTDAGGGPGTAARRWTAASGCVASQTIVSTPSAGDRSSGRMTRWKPGSDSASPGVSAQPGCIAANATAPRASAAPTRASARPGPVWPAHRRAARESAAPRTGGRRASRRCVYMPPEVTAITRDPRRPAQERQRGHASSANGPTTRSAKVASMPSGLSDRRSAMDRAGVVDQDVEPRLGRQDPIDRRRGPSASEPMSATTTGKRSSPCAATSARSERAASRASLRPTSTTRAPQVRERPCRRQAEARGRPGHERRSALRGHRARRPVQPNSRRRTAGPMRLKLPTTEISSAASTRRGSVQRVTRRVDSGLPIRRGTVCVTNIRQTLYTRGRTMTMLRERIETALPARATPSTSSPTSPTPRTGIRASRRRCASTRAGRRRRAVSTGRADGRPGRRRWTTRSRPASRHRASCSRARARASRAVDDIRFEATADRHPDRLHRRHPARRPPAPRRAVRRRGVRADRARGARRHAARARRRARRA